MSVSYKRVNWADYPATTTPVNATNLNKMDKGIADLTSEVNSVASDMSNLNSSLQDSMGGTSDKFQFATDGNGNYGYVKKVSGADTFFPFSGKLKGWATIASGTSNSTVVLREHWMNPSGEIEYQDITVPLNSDITGSKLGFTHRSGYYTWGGNLWTVPTGSKVFGQNYNYANQYYSISWDSVRTLTADEASKVIMQTSYTNMDGVWFFVE